MATSSNGYQVLDADTTGPYPRLRNFTLPGVNRKLLSRDGSCGFLLVHIALWFDEEVERIDVGGLDDWGWSARRISGSTLWSNHASGTAIDLNSTLHPMGVATRATFSVKEVARIHNRLKMYAGCLRWGGDYRGRPDAMHFEIDKAIDRVVVKASELVKTPRGKRICAANPGLEKLILD
jgi:hypothetical protein